MKQRTPAADAAQSIIDYLDAGVAAIEWQPGQNSSLWRSEQQRRGKGEKAEMDAVSPSSNILLTVDAKDYDATGTAYPVLASVVPVPDLALQLNFDLRTLLTSLLSSSLTLFPLEPLPAQPDEPETFTFERDDLESKMRERAIPLKGIARTLASSGGYEQRWESIGDVFHALPPWPSTAEADWALFLAREPLRLALGEYKGGAPEEMDDLVDQISTKMRRFAELLLDEAGEVRARDCTGGELRPLNKGEKLALQIARIIGTKLIRAGDSGYAHSPFLTLSNGHSWCLFAGTIDRRYRVPFLRIGVSPLYRLAAPLPLDEPSYFGCTVSAALHTLETPIPNFPSTVDLNVLLIPDVPAKIDNAVPDSAFEGTQSSRLTELGSTSAAQSADSTLSELSDSASGGLSGGGSGAADRRRATAPGCRSGVEQGVDGASEDDEDGQGGGAKLLVAGREGADPSWVDEEQPKSISALEKYKLRLRVQHSGLKSDWLFFSLLSLPDYAPPATTLPHIPPSSANPSSLSSFCLPPTRSFAPLAPLPALPSAYQRLLSPSQPLKLVADTHVRSGHGGKELVLDSSMGIVVKYGLEADIDNELVREAEIVLELQRVPSFLDFTVPHAAYRTTSGRIALATPALTSLSHLDSLFTPGLNPFAPVAALHAEGYLHGDLAPRNFVRTPFGLRLIDLARTRKASEAERRIEMDELKKMERRALDRFRLERATLPMGTPIPPEQATLKLAPSIAG